MVRVPSITGSDAESELQHWCVDRLRTAEMDTDVWKLDLDGLRADPRFPGTEAPRVEGYGVVATLHGAESGDARIRRCRRARADPPGARRRRPDR